MKKIPTFALVIIFGVFTASCANVFSPRSMPNTSSSIPFFTPSEFGPSVRYQQVYSEADFDAAGGSQLWITEIGFRAGASLDLPYVEIRFSSTTRNEGDLSAVFNDNFGPDVALVYSGALHVENNPFIQNGFRIPFQRSFLYDREAGNLLMEVKNFDTADIPVELRQFSRMSAHDSPGDGTAERVSFDVNSSTAHFSDTVGLETLFLVEPVPEPSTVLLLFGGLLAGGFAVIRNRLRTK